MVTLDGRLIVLGGYGESQSLPNIKLEHFADNDGWSYSASVISNVTSNATSSPRRHRW
jgi:L-lysine epsilon oxidase-like protein